VVLVYSPEYIESQRITRNRGQILADLRAIATEFRVPLWDFSGEAVGGMREYFYNSQHLNRKGATAFSQMLGERLVDELGLRSAGRQEPVQAGATATPAAFGRDTSPPSRGLGRETPVR
jgi:hypothetical protein